MSPLLVALFAGCNPQDLRTVEGAECATEVVPVAGDERVPGFSITADEVFDTVQGAFAFAAFYEDGAPVTGGGAVTRGAGSAFAVLGTTVGTSPSGMEGPTCDSALHVPVEVQFATDDGRIAFATPALATPSITRADGQADLFHVEADPAPEGIEAVPDPLEPGAVLGISLQWTPATFDWVSLWYSGLDYEQVLEGPAR